jgi:DNA-binding XRE family transcriptional regulator
MSTDCQRLAIFKWRAPLGVESDNVYVDAHHAARAISQAVETRQMFGRNLRRARISAGLTPGDIQDRAGVPQEFVDEIEQGRADPSLRTMVTLAFAVERDLWLLLEPAG